MVFIHANDEDTPAADTERAKAALAQEAESGDLNDTLYKAITNSPKAMALIKRVITEETEKVTSKALAENDDTNTRLAELNERLDRVIEKTAHGLPDYQPAAPNRKWAN
jgi:hypothetical protein